MASLTVRNIPEDVMEALRDAAQAQQRSVNAQALHWLEHGAREQPTQTELNRLFRKIRASREAIYRRYGLGSDSAKIIRDMRDGRAKLRTRNRR